MSRFMAQVLFLCAQASADHAMKTIKSTSPGDLEGFALPKQPKEESNVVFGNEANITWYLKRQTSGQEEQRIALRSSSGRSDADSSTQQSQQGPPGPLPSGVGDSRMGSITSNTYYANGGSVTPIFTHQSNVVISERARLSNSSTNPAEEYNGPIRDLRSPTHSVSVGIPVPVTSSPSMTRKENGPRKENGGAKASNVVRQSSVTSVTSVASSGHDDRPIVTEAARREQEAYHNERMAEAAQKQHKQLRQQQWEAELQREREFISTSRR